MTLTQVDLGSATADEWRAPVPTDLPSAPSDASLYRYLQRPQRAVYALTLLAYVPFMMGLFVVAHRSPWLWFLMAPATLNVVYYAVSAFSGLRRGRITQDSHEERVRTWVHARAVDGAYPSVDVFLPTCGEDLAILENTYRHVNRLAWPGRLRVWVLDDADRPEVARAARRAGFDYVVRPDRGHMKKAGNLRHAYGMSDGELIVVLDADFCPRSDYLHHLVPYLEDPEVGIVQSPQYFATTESMSWLERGAGSMQELFYRRIQPSRDALGAAICVGTCAVYRRSALEAAGGFAQIEHSEDVHTGLAVQRGGSRLQYVPVIVSQGVCPDDFGAFVSQQYRWCLGSMSLLTSGLRRTYGVSRLEATGYWTGFLYYLCTGFNALFIQVPVVAMLGFFIADVDPHYFVYLLPALWVQVVLNPLVMSTRWRLDALSASIVSSYAHLLALFHTARGRAAAWVPTGDAKRSSTAGPVARLVVLFSGFTITAAWCVLVLRLLERGPEQLWAATLFTTVYTSVALPAVVVAVRHLLRRPARGRRRVVLREEETVAQSRLSWSDAVARTVLIVCAGLLAAGVVDPWFLLEV